jgi:RNA-directed DNA polymerase
VIQGWCNYYQHGVSSRAYHRVANQLWYMLWHWATRRHPNKSGRWIAERYWKEVGQRKWVFGNAENTLRNPTDTKIVRWVKVRGRNSPYDPTLRDYWTNRNQRAIADRTPSWKKLAAIRAQGYRCRHCGLVFQTDDAIDLHHRIPQAEGGTDTMSNLMALHEHCHYQLHANCDK